MGDLGSTFISMRVRNSCGGTYKLSVFRNMSFLLVVKCTAIVEYPNERLASITWQGIDPSFTNHLGTLFEPVLQFRVRVGHRECLTDALMLHAVDNHIAAGDRHNNRFFLSDAKRLQRGAAL